MKHLISNNPFAQKLKSRAKAPMRVWWKNNKLVVAEEAARAERDDIGKKGKVAARLYAALSLVRALRAQWTMNTFVKVIASVWLRPRYAISG